MGIGSSSLLSLSGEGWAVAHVGIRTGLATNILVLFNRHRLAQQRKLSKDSRPAITATSSALLGSANQCLAFFALSVVAQSHLNQGRDSPFPAPSQYSMQWPFQLLLGNAAFDVNCCYATGGFPMDTSDTEHAYFVNYREYTKEWLITPRA